MPASRPLVHTLVATTVVCEAMPGDLAADGFCSAIHRRRIDDAAATLNKVAQDFFKARSAELRRRNESATCRVDDRITRKPRGIGLRRIDWPIARSHQCQRSSPSGAQ
jgi:hypothetical protein